MRPGEVNWDDIFGEQGVRWFHTGGIFCALSSSTQEVAQQAMQAARRHETTVSYDLNYRPSLWKTLGGKQRAQEVNRRLAPYVNVMIGNEEDFSAALGYEVPGMDENFSDFEIESFKKMISQVVKDYPFDVVATTLRKAKTATRNDWGAICYSDGNFYQAKNREDLEILDRVGGGDSFASGLIYGFLAGEGPQWAVECGAAHGALAMTTPGDTSMASLKEVLQVMKGVGARIAR
jgi:2-dehydro-3-deoxygluconokinase